jgi:hypothetical protein
VQRNQTGWVAALPRIRFNYMCTVNKSMGYSPFMLRLGRDPIVLPPLEPARDPITQDEVDARAVITHIYNAVKDANVTDWEHSWGRPGSAAGDCGSCAEDRRKGLASTYVLRPRSTSVPYLEAEGT